MSSRPINSTMALKAKCSICSKPYKFGYMKKHMKKEHCDLAKDPELVEQEEVDVNMVNMWFENKKDIYFAARYFDLFLNNKSDLDIMIAVDQAKRLDEAEMQMALREHEMV